MTRERGFKRLVRARMGRTGEAYTTARARLRQRGARPALPAMTRRELQHLPDAELVARCAPGITRLLHERDAAARHAAIRRLTAGQAGLLAFWLVDAHAGDGVAGLCAALPHRMVDDDFWALLMAGLGGIGEAELQSIARRLRAEVSKTVAGGPFHPAPAAEMDETAFTHLVETLQLLDPGVLGQLDDEYRRVAPGSLRRLAQRIREHPREFVALEA